MNVRKKVNLVLLVLLVFFTISSYGQKQFELNGNVSAFHKYPVKGLKVVTKKAKTSTVTDDKGNFTITCNKRDKIEIKAPGFETVSRSVTSKNSFIEINMIVIEGEKNTKFIIDNGFLKEDDLKYGWEHFANENYDFANYFDIYDLIEDRFEGTIIERSSSVPEVSFRRASDMSPDLSLSAVFQVDGNIRGDLTNIKPTDIVSIKLYKGPQAYKIAGKEVAGAFVIVLK